ncbi:MAG TPA: serine/threonine-protein kinase [Acidobacteriaceae bacterium]|nr:serine/threonine-protein kinase [Acidobacteriaceae bacterium]
MIDIHAGTQLDHYRIDSFVASSKITALYRATDLDTGKSVAIKVPHANMLADAVFAERFHREEEIGINLDHPGVIKVFPNPHRTQMYMVMEWVDGQILREALNQEGRFPQERAIRIALAICESLDYVHSHGISHRDLRPEHIVLLPGDHIKLIDFGLAGQVGAKRVTFTNISELISDGNYLAPEQIAGKRGDPRSDLYAVGVMLYEMLTGSLPYGDNTSLDKFNDRLLHDPVPVRKIDPSISPELEEILRRALERNPVHRYGSVRELAHDLAHPESVKIAGPAPSKDVSASVGEKSGKRNVLIYGLLAVPALLFLLILLFSHFR